MKFGKKILEACELTQSTFKEDSWVGYKRLKKVLKTYELSPGAQQVDLRTSNEAKEFFSLLRKDLLKVSREYLNKEKQLVQHCLLLITSIQNSVQGLPLLTSKVLEAHLKQIAELHKDFLVLRNFAVLNYCGFTKILKEHDKVTGCRTKDKFLRNLVNKQPFVPHELVKKGAEILSDLFIQVKQRNIPVDLQTCIMDFVISSTCTNIQEELNRKTGAAVEPSEKKTKFLI